MQRRALPSARIIFFTALALTVPAAADETHVESDAAPTASAPLTPAESAALERTLNFDALALTNAPARSFGAPTLTHPHGVTVSRSAHDDGSSTVTVAQPLSDDWKAKVGADFGAAAAPAVTYDPDRPLPGAVKNNLSNAAWASVGVTRYATVNARVDPGGEQGSLGATLEHAVPLGDGTSVALRSHYAVRDTLAPAAQGSLVPVLSNNQTVKLNIGATGTTLSAGMSADSVDPLTHNTLSADQQVYGPLHVTTAITDAGQPTSNKSITAKFKLTW